MGTAAPEPEQVRRARRPRFPGALGRPRLTAAISAPVVVLAAPAGSGKTVLAAQLADTVGPGTAIAWVRPDRPGCDARGLARLIRAALGGPPTITGVDPAVLAGDVLDAAGDAPVFVVVDDADQADPGELARLLGELAPYLDAASRVVICARSRPAGLVGRLGPALCQVLTSRDLAFIPDEVTALLAAYAERDSAAPPWSAADILQASGGWAVAVAAYAATTGPHATAPPLREVLDSILAGATDAARAALDALSLAPALSRAAARAAGLDPAALEQLPAYTPLVQEEADRLRLAEAARTARAARIPAEAGIPMRLRLGRALATEDPAAAIDLLLDAGEPAEAAAVLARSLGTLPVDWVRPRLYRLPAEVRRSLPPALSAAEATVDLGSAITFAQQSLAEAVAAGDPGAEGTARFALGSAYAHEGNLESAAAELEAATRRTTGPVRAAAAAWLGMVRFWVGDLTGADAAAGTAPDLVLAAWVRAETALARGDVGAAATAADRAGELAEQPGADLGPSVGRALAARIAVRRGGTDLHAAARIAEDAYRLAAAGGGFELLATAPVHAGFLLAADRIDEAEAVADTLRRQVGRHDVCSRLQAALVRLAVARRRGDERAADRATESVAAVRRSGFGVIEEEARGWLLGLTSPEQGLRITYLGPVAITVDGTPLAGDAWRSRKARETLLVLAAAGSRGMRREEVIEAVWPDRDPERGRMLLRTALSDVRRVLEPRRVAGEPSAYLDAGRDRVRVVADTDLDAARALAAADSDDDLLKLVTDDVAAGEPDIGGLEVVRDEVRRFRARAALRIARDAKRPPDDRASAYDVVLSAEPWRTELAEEVVAMWWRVGDEARAMDADRRYLSDQDS